MKLSKAGESISLINLKLFRLFIKWTLILCLSRSLSGGGVPNTMYTHVSKCNNVKRKEGRREEGREGGEERKKEGRK
jgi:hypothetical protein